MKINSDLRAAIRSAVTEANKSETWQVKAEQRKQAVEELRNKPHVKPKIAKAEKLLKEGRAKCAEALAILTEFGLNCNSSDTFGISDEDAFEAAGGKLPQPSKQMRFDKVMAEVAAASEEEAVKILKGIGINWD